jgi:acetolactate synthase-1/3 small subunit
MGGSTCTAYITGKLALKREPVFCESRRRRVKLMDAMKEAKAAVSGLSGGGNGSSGEYETTLASRIVRAVANMDENADGEMNIGDTYAAMDDG